MTPHHYVVFADRMRGFDNLEEARAFASANPPAVICERRKKSEGARRSVLVEVERYDWLYDEKLGEWRHMFG